MAVQFGPIMVIGEGERAPAKPYVRILPPPTDAQFYPWWSASTREVLAKLPDMKGLRVCDFGCGAVAILAIAAKRLGAGQVVAVEQVESIANEARRQIAANQLNIDVIHGQEVPGTFDYLIANVGNAELVGRLSKQATHGIGTDSDGGILAW